ncbi:rhomboid family intramembrane serine protease [Nocardioides rotundus]|uniref:rhomboid family intramembrane serine protease n=1 Tax=Nocardioides rotundus TaxID=1774216 RepID=UPI001CC1BF21|nr:rhomboid family intramembrane serine protease [Nocardioides rotundus]UAL30016.1 rhomboid family intramembrane serine protease [Nocardioides rotundus]
MSAGGDAGQPPVPTCYRHPDRGTYVSCQRCGRSICPDCMREATVGHQCPDCVAEGARRTGQHEAPYGGRASRNPALTSWVLIGINVAVWAGIMLTGGSRSRWEYVLSLSPVGRCYTDDFRGWFPDATEAMCRMGGQATWIPGVSDGAWWQLVTSAFTHVEILHLGFNMLALWFLGPQLELILGRARFLAVYLVSAMAGSAVVMAFADPASHTLGASGAIFGMLGALLVVAHKIGGNYQQLLMWVVINFVITFTMPGISWQGHLGGFVAGLLLAAAIVYAPAGRRTLIGWSTAGLMLLAAAVAIGARVAVLA